MRKVRYISTLLVLLFTTFGAKGQTQPSATDEAPKFAKQLQEAEEKMALVMSKDIEVPIPKDMAGGYTHEQHKRNWDALYNGGRLYKLTQHPKYARYVRDVLMVYAEMYPTLPLHPSTKSYAPGKLFWQCLNDANWLLFASQAFDDIYDFLSKEEKKKLERELFRPMIDFLSLQNPKFFNRIHNHSTWACAAIGMAALVLEDKKLLKRALYGLPIDAISEEAVDNDGGFINHLQKAGFLAQMDYAFSPDGYFSEGPYYLRYAIYPYLIFAAKLDEKRPDLNIWAYRDSILKKAIYAMINQTDADGLILPINDAQKGMSWNSRGVVTAVNIGYASLGEDPILLTIASKLDHLMLNEAGRKVAEDLDRKNTPSLKRPSISWKDGWNGEMGGLTILRAGEDEKSGLSLVHKYTSHGGGHGHFDRLSYSLYDDGGEVIQDYGAARWVNIDQKGGGRYLKENKSFAKQTIAHNTVVVNQKTQFGGKVKDADKVHPILLFQQLNQKGYQVVATRDTAAYKGVDMSRIQILLDDDGFTKPLFIDIFLGKSENPVDWDLPTWFQGEFLEADVNFIQEPVMKPLGERHGYQHIWQDGKAAIGEGTHTFSWMDNDHIYTISCLSIPDDEWILGRLGANDPLHNLRRDPVLIQRKRKQKEVLFAQILEAHGTYDRVTEIPFEPYGKLALMKVELLNEMYVILSFQDQVGNSWTLCQSRQNMSGDILHEVSRNGKNWEWKGPFVMTKSKTDKNNE
ncbi:MAG: heparinase II/III family protein [Bacteroidota bacterium]